MRTLRSRVAQTRQMGARISAGNLRYLPSPLALPGLQIWLDGSDPATMFQDAAGTTPVASENDPVGRWVDKSAAGHVFDNSTSGQKPVYRPNIQGGKSVVRFDGIDDRLTNAVSTATLVKNVASASVVMAVSNVAMNSADSTSFSFTVAATGAVRARKLKRTTNKYALSGRRLDGDANQTVESSAAGASPKVLAGNFLWDQAKAQLFENGTKVADTVFQTAGNTSDTNTIVFIGSTSSSQAFFAGDICEIVVCVPALSDADRAKLETYLQAKWSIT